MKKDYLEVILEDINSKFDLVLEGYSSLDKKIDNLAQKTEERFDLVDFMIDTINTELKKTNAKIDAVASDLKAHRQDTEAHGGMYCVKEG